ncbi:MAG: PKD domain-containing protein [Patescibacteria group bacterium]
MPKPRLTALLIFVFIFSSVFVFSPESAQAGYWVTGEYQYGETVTCYGDIVYNDYGLRIKDLNENLNPRLRDIFDLSIFGFGSVVDGSFNPSGGDFTYTRVRNTSGSGVPYSPQSSNDPCYPVSDTVSVVTTVSQGWDFSYFDITNPSAGGQWRLNLVNISSYTTWTANRTWTTSGSAYVPTPPSIDITINGQSPKQITLPAGNHTIGWTITCGINTNDNWSVDSWPLVGAPSPDFASCRQSSDGYAAPKTISGSQTITFSKQGTYRYAARVSNGDGSNEDQETLKIEGKLNDEPTVSNVKTTEGDYCSGISAAVSWKYSDPDGDSQSAYRVQVDPIGSSFSNPEVDSGKVSSSGTGYAANLKSFNTTYKARVKVWDSQGNESSWGESGSWKTPAHAYPAAGFTWQEISSKKVQFTDATTFSDNSKDSKKRKWSWQFGDNGSSNQQNPLYTYKNTGSYNAVLTATDSDNFSCSTTQPISVKKSIPEWKEVRPRF